MVLALRSRVQHATRGSSRTVGSLRRSVHPPKLFMDEFADEYVRAMASKVNRTVRMRRTRHLRVIRRRAYLASIHPAPAAVAPAPAPAVAPARRPGVTRTRATRVTRTRPRAAPTTTGFTFGTTATPTFPPSAPAGKVFAGQKADVVQDAFPDGTPSKGIFHFPGVSLPTTARMPALEICFSFDTTGSMSSYLQQVKQDVDKLVGTLLADLPDIRVSVLAHGDYGDCHNYTLQRVDLSNDAGLLSDFVRSVGSTSGYDGDECYELVLRDVQSLSWTPGTAKVLVVIGDADPHPKTSYHKIDWEEELSKLKSLGVRCYAVFCGNNNPNNFFKTIAEETDGKTLTLNGIHAINELVMGLCYRESAELHMERPENFNLVRTHSTQEVFMLDGRALPISSADALLIHTALHDGSDSVTLSGVSQTIGSGYAGCRFLRYKEITFIEQNKDESSKYAQMASADGKKITWIVWEGTWGFIVDNIKTLAMDTDYVPILPSGHRVRS